MGYHRGSMRHAGYTCDARCAAGRETDVVNVVMSCNNLGDRKLRSVLKTMSDETWRAKTGGRLSLTSLH